MKRKVTVPPRDDESPAAVVVAVREALERRDQLLKASMANSGGSLGPTAGKQAAAAQRHRFDVENWWAWLRERGHAAEAEECRKLFAERHLSRRDQP